MKLQLKISKINTIEDGLFVYGIVCRFMNYYYRKKDYLHRLKQFRAWVKIRAEIPRSCEYPNWCYNPEHIEGQKYNLEWCHKCRIIYKISQRIKRISYVLRGIHKRIRSILEVKTLRKTKYDDPKMWGVEL